MSQAGILNSDLNVEGNSLNPRQELMRFAVASLALLVVGLMTSPVFETVSYDTSHIRLLPETVSAELIPTPQATAAPLVAVHSGKKKSRSLTSSSSLTKGQTNKDLMKAENFLKLEKRRAPTHAIAESTFKHHSPGNF